MAADLFAGAQSQASACFIRFHGELTKENCCYNNDRAPPPAPFPLHLPPGRLWVYCFAFIRHNPSATMRHFGHLWCSKVVAKARWYRHCIPTPLSPFNGNWSCFCRGKATRSWPSGRYQSYLCSNTYDGTGTFCSPLHARTLHKPVCVIYASHSWKILWIPHTPIPVVVSCLFYFFSCQADNQILNNIKVAFVSWQTMRIMHEQKAPNPQHATNLDLGPHLLAKNLNASVGTNMSENNGQLTCALSCFQ